MDSVSEELHNFLIRLGQHPDCVSEKIEHKTSHTHYPRR